MILASAIRQSRSTAGSVSVQAFQTDGTSSAGNGPQTLNWLQTAKAAS